MRRAYRASGAEAAVLGFLRPRDVAIHIRCFPFFHSTYPLTGFSFYRALPAPWRHAPDLRLLLVAGALGPSCALVAEALEAYLLREYPQAEMVRQYTTLEDRGTMAEDVSVSSAVERDFVLLASAPVLFRTPGSFSLWAALSSDKLVLSTPNDVIVADWTWKTADFGPSWRWIDAPLLTRRVADEQKFEFEDAGPWVRWLEAN